MRSRRACLGLLLLILAGCAAPAAGGSPATSPQGLVVVTAGGTALDDGTADVPPTLELGLEGAGVTPSVASATLDGDRLTLTSSSRGVTASVAPMAYASEHQLVIDVAGRPQEVIGFQVVDRTGVSAAAWRGAGGQLVCQVVFERAPDRVALAAALPQAQLHWIDGTHLSLAWATPPASLTIPAGLSAARGSVLEGPLMLPLTGLQTGQLHRATVPAAVPAPAGLRLTLWTDGTAASDASARAHAAQAAILSPTGWQAESDGGLQGAPEPTTLAAAAAAGRPVWPVLKNDDAGPTGTDQLLNSASACSALITAVVSQVQSLRLAGVNLDFEGVPGSDESALTAFAGRLSSALRAAGAGLSIDVVPHTAAGTNSASAAYDDPGLAAVADYLVVMAYDENTQAGDPGPVAGIDWQAAELDGTMAGVAAAKIVLGVPLYARSWSGNHVTSGGYASMVAQALGEPDVSYDYDFPAATPVLLSDPGGVPTQLWFDDADSLLRKIDAAGTLGLGGVAAWVAGDEDPAFWSVV
ncbi:MAG: glycosyl hydrolase family 18 protein [Candidatus Dormibacteria bacterium]|jgi:spore germination protein YaaH